MQLALLQRQSNYSDASELKKMVKWLMEKLEVMDTLKSHLQVATHCKWGWYDMVMARFGGR